MHKSLKEYNSTKGFMALTSLIIIFTTLFTFSLISFWITWDKYDQQILKLERIQSGYNLNSCLDFAKLMIYKDYYINGKIYLKSFACDLFFENNYNKIKIYATSTFDRVKLIGGLIVDLPI